MKLERIKEADREALMARMDEIFNMPFRDLTPEEMDNLDAEVTAISEELWERRDKSQPDYVVF